MVVVFLNFTIPWALASKPFVVLWFWWINVSGQWNFYKLICKINFFLYLLPLSQLMATNLRERNFVCTTHGCFWVLVYKPLVGFWVWRKIGSEHRHSPNLLYFMILFTSYTVPSQNGSQSLRGQPFPMLFSRLVFATAYIGSRSMWARGLEKLATVRPQAETGEACMVVP